MEETVSESEDEEATAIEETENVEVNILEIKDVDGEEVYDTVTDEELGKKVFEEFTKNQEEYEEE